MPSPRAARLSGRVRGGLLWEPQEAMEPQAGVPVARPHLCLGEHVGPGAGQDRVTPCRGMWGRRVLGAQGLGGGGLCALRSPLLPRCDFSIHDFAGSDDSCCGRDTVCSDTGPYMRDLQVGKLRPREACFWES